MFLRSAGQGDQRKQASLVQRLLPAAISESIRRNDLNILNSRLRAIVPDDLHCQLILLAVAITRNIQLPAPLMHCGAESDRKLFREKTLDALLVIFMFNMINRVANAYDLPPEWTAFRSSNLLTKIGQAIMSRGIAFVMPLNEIATSDSEPFDLEQRLRDFGIQHAGKVWHFFESHPRTAVAIQQLLIASRWYCDQDNGELDRITQQLLLEAQRKVRSDPSGQKDIGRINANSLKNTLAAAKTLMFNPDRFCETDLKALTTEGWSELRILDLVLRVALLAGISKMNGVIVDELVLSLETETQLETKETSKF